MNLLVTGPGMVGTHLIDSLLREGHTVRSFSRGPSPVRHRQGARYEHIRGDITDRDAVSAAARDTDGIIHLAARSRSGACDEDPVDCLKVNVLGTINVLDAACARTGLVPWVIIMGSSAVRDAQGGKGLDASSDAYGCSKVLTEIIAKKYAYERDMRVLVLRPETIFGSLNDSADKVVNSFARAALAGKPLQVHDDKASGGFVYYEDVITACLISLRKIAALETSAYYEAIYLGNGRYVQLYELARMIVSISKSRSEVLIESPAWPRRHPAPRIPARHSDEIARSSKFLDNIGWVELESGLARLINAMRGVAGSS